MKIGVTANYVTVTSKMRKLADGDAKTFKSQLDKIRLGLDGAYQGQENLTGELLSLEKKIDAFSSRMSSLASVFDQGASELLTSANQAGNVGELAPLSKELEFVLANPTTAQLITRNLQILTARAFTEKYKNSAMLTSPLGVTLFAGASTMALLPLLNTNASSKGIDSWFKEHNPEEYRIANMELIKSSEEFNTGIAQPNKKACVYSSKANILNRKKMLDTGDTSKRITEEQVQSTFQNFKQRDSHCYNQFAKEYMHNKTQSYNGTVVDGYDYFFNDDKNVSEAAIRNCLDNHPEGIAVYSDTVGHAITITDYEVGSDGSIQYYAMDSAKAKGYSNDRIRIEDTWTYQKTKSASASGYLSKFNHIISIE